MYVCVCMRFGVQQHCCSMYVCIITSITCSVTESSGITFGRTCVNTITSRNKIPPPGRCHPGFTLLFVLGCRCVRFVAPLGCRKKQRMKPYETVIVFFLFFRRVSIRSRPKAVLRTTYCVHAYILYYCCSHIFGIFFFLASLFGSTQAQPFHATKPCAIQPDVALDAVVDVSLHT